MTLLQCGLHNVKMGKFFDREWGEGKERVGRKREE